MTQNAILIACLLFSISVLGCGNTVSDPNVAGKVNRFNILADLAMGDHRRDIVPTLLDDVDLSTPEGLAELDTRIKDFENVLDGFPEWCPARDPALQKLKALDFQIDDGISESTATSVVGVFFDNEYLDPRIIEMSVIDSKTIEIMTGEVSGPLDGGGCYYIARLEDGIWRVRRSSLWVS
jgi:hypothetical protein